MVLGQDQKAAIVRDPVQPVVWIAKDPTDPVITRRLLPGSGAKAQQRQPSSQPTIRYGRSSVTYPGTDEHPSTL